MVPDLVPTGPYPTAEDEGEGQLRVISQGPCVFGVWVWHGADAMPLRTAKHGMPVHVQLRCWGRDGSMW